MTRHKFLAQVYLLFRVPPCHFSLLSEFRSIEESKMKAIHSSTPPSFLLKQLVISPYTQKTAVHYIHSVCSVYEIVCEFSHS